MAQYHLLDDSGDPGLGDPGSSSHFALAMVQMPERVPLSELAALRRMFHLPPMFEFKYYRAKSRQKEVFFRMIRPISFRVRAVVIDKSCLGNRFAGMSGQDLTIEFITGLVLRAEQLDLAHDVLVVDGATLGFLRPLRIRLSEECRKLGRVRPFRRIISGDSKRDDGLQLADMVAGAIRHYVMGEETAYYRTFASKVADLWKVP